MITLNSTIQRYRETFKAAVINNDIDSLISLMDSLSEDLIQGKYHHVPYCLEDDDSEKIKQIKRTLNRIHLGKQMAKPQHLQNLNSFKSYEGSIFLKGLRILRKKNTAEFVRIATKVTSSPLQYPKNCDKEIKRIETLIQGVLKEQELNQDSYSALKIIYSWRSEWEKQALRSYRRNMSISDDMSRKAALLAEELIKKRDKRVLSLLEDSESSAPYFQFSWLHGFGRFVIKGFLDEEERLYELLDIIYTQSPSCCLNLTACVLDKRLHEYERNFSDNFRQRCLIFIDRVINDFEEKNNILLGTALGTKFIWHTDNQEKQIAYERLVSLISKKQISNPEEVIRWIGLLLPHSHKQTDGNWEILLQAFREGLDGLSAQQTVEHMYPHIIQLNKIIKNSEGTECATLQAMEKAEKIDTNRVFDGYIHLALQKGKSTEFTDICVRKVENFILSKLDHDPEEAARMLNRIGQISKNSARDDKFPAVMNVIEPLLKKIYALNTESVKFAKVTYGSHGTGPLQHPKYVEIFTEFASSNR